MASFSLQNLCKVSVFSLVFISTVTVATASFQFKVGGDKGWTKPTGNDSEPYNQWASRNRFHVGDSLYFKYNNDSVLVVNRSSYTDCSVANPTFEFKDGETVFEFDRYGFFYFISGERGHCEAGQKLIVRVMVHPMAENNSPQQAPSPMEDDGDGDGDGWDSMWGQPPHNSTMKQTAASYFMTALGGMLVIMYLLM